MIDGAAAILIAFWKYKKKKYKKKINKKMGLEHKTSDSKIQNEINV